MTTNPTTTSAPLLTLTDVLWAAANYITKAGGRNPQDCEVVLKGLQWAIEKYTPSTERALLSEAQDDDEPDFEEADNGKCPYCGRQLTLDGTTLYCEQGCY